ncbi:hypothetical protein IWW55_000302 [Coemansia sp. RSA 2706]|nr:hypothetical protein IWW55_000302 [Coemansia sp. RSA 2706]KAJ2315231.1 hypothetical protein IWW54_000426 [Coemansia sp. RSA 2705]KAJ2322011.1 hypothetical protein IWW52_000369 [Coemansia sp. RSA 2704]KAJ2328425.1 hypothetical protein IWW51_001211 [Coemansia sp. RSA 2702]KAJ2369906.1 hypothetical protein H4S01_000712 [Coemansia sp. RSA 2610]KAJ2393248.1 hypothetical protein H4S02_000323 [Coemansia sp. RSA 2611]KAJ2738969.1 hypothetical protein H4R23_000781 [Coemansia sp. Cherry 401B]
MSASVASKYANLPDIDVEQPDVYETPDVAADESYDLEAEVPQSEDISTDNVPTGRAAARFRESAGDVDPKSALARYQRSLFRTLQLESLSGDIEVVSGAGGASLNETAEQRLRRLVYETQELKEQLAADTQNQQTKQSVSLMKLASGLHDDLAQLSVQSEKEGGASLLWQQLEQQGSGASETSRPAQRAGTADVSAFDRRIAALEKLVGANAAQPVRDASVGHNLADSVARLRQQMDVLADPQRIDGIQRRIKQVLVEMDRLELANKQATKAAAEASEAKGANASVRLDPAAIKRIDDLYEKLAHMDSLIELAPATARRLQSLSKLHVEASDAVARIGRVDSEQANISDELATMKEVATSLKASMAENTETLKANVAHLDSRIAALTDRLAALAK